MMWKPQYIKKALISLWLLFEEQVNEEHQINKEFINNMQAFGSFVCGSISKMSDW